MKEDGCRRGQTIFFQFSITFYSGKLKKGTGFKENHEYNIFVVLNREIFGK